MKMSLRTISIILVSALLLTGIGVYLAQAQKPVENAVKSVQVQPEPLNANKILELVNAERAKVGVAPLVSDPGLVATAQSRVDDMIARDYYSHNDPVTGESLVKIKATNPQCIVASENINEAYTAAEALNKWMASKPHHDAMLNEKYTLTGIGVAKNYNKGWFEIVQHFCQQ